MIPISNQKDNKAPMRGSTKVHCWCIEETAARQRGQPSELDVDSNFKSEG
jgi:hypothetical protein